MSHKNRESLIKQVTDILVSKQRFGESKYNAKKDGTYTEGIYSFSTFHAYLKHSVAFVKWCKEQHRCRTVADCRRYVDEYLQSRSELSAYTVKLDAAALAKLYGCGTSEFVHTAPRHRSEIARSRGEAVRDRHFSKANHADLVAFCRATGLRRHELAALRGVDRKEEDGALYVHVRSGKGGKERWVRVIGDTEAVRRLMLDAGNRKVFPKIPSAADIHGYRREYAAAYYRMIARPAETLSADEKYICRKDKRGIVYDRAAMLEVSLNLGHNRINVIAGNYLD